jgi:hypothetical protein
MWRREGWKAEQVGWRDGPEGFNVFECKWWRGSVRNEKRAHVGAELDLADDRRRSSNLGLVLNAREMKSNGGRNKENTTAREWLK